MSIVINGKTIANYTEISTSTSLGTSDTKVPSENAVKTYVDNAVESGVHYAMIVADYTVDNTSESNNTNDDGTDSGRDSGS